MQLFDSFSVVGVLAYDLADYYEWVCTVTSLMTKDDLSESVKTAVEQFLKRSVPCAYFDSLQD